MSKHGIIRRYTLEIEKIKSNLIPSFEEIKDYLHDFGFEISDRTLQRDIEQIRFEFGVDIQYNRDKNGYYIDYKNSINIESFFRFLEIVNTAELLTESLSESKEVLKYISFDNEGGLKGAELLKPILQAIKKQTYLQFNHHSFWHDEAKNYCLKPYLLKEFANRWYLVGIFENGKEFRTFGLERISNLVELPKKFKRIEKLNPTDNFDKVIGLMYSEGEQLEVVLSFTPLQGKYVKTLPWHHSQKVIIDNNVEFRISLFVIPNYELLQMILKHSDSVKVISPQLLVDEVKDALQAAFKKYE